jgi:hypothetical protein
MDITVLCSNCHELFHVKRELYEEPGNGYQMDTQKWLRQQIPDELRDIIKR